MSISQSQKLLVDVRSPAEFATGALANDLYSAVNIEFQSIDQLPEVYRDLGIDVHKGDDITLYCRSGRRSNIALQTLRDLGYTHVRDIGGLEEARAVLKKEEFGRITGAEEEMKRSRVQKSEGKKEVLAQSFGNLLDGLKSLDT
jgi:rhodanese-related sulfurtransferase